MYNPPTIFDVATEFFAKNGMAAEKRRRNDIAFCNGTTLAQIRDHLLQNVKFSFRDKHPLFTLSLEFLVRKIIYF